MPKDTELDVGAIRTAYEDVRKDETDTNWAVFKHNGKMLCHDSSGMDYNEFKSKFTDDDRGFGFVRCTTGDELSKRCKFALITWIGANISPLPRAKMSTDKSLLKSIIVNYAVEIQPSDPEELEEDSVKETLRKAGGANYGTGGGDLGSETNGTRSAEPPAEPTPPPSAPAPVPEPEPEPVSDPEPEPEPEAEFEPEPEPEDDVEVPGEEDCSGIGNGADPDFEHVQEDREDEQ